LIDIRYISAKSVLFHLLRGGVRSVMTAVLALMILAPYLQGFAMVLVAGSPACEMQCCKTAKAACHRSNSHQDDHQFPRWTAGPQCPSGCGQVVSLTGPVCHGVSAGALLTGPGLRATYLTGPVQSACVTSATEFALFERPPPFFG
jgi:hypothetical protein